MTIQIDDFKMMLNDHMECQPYVIRCSSCGKSLLFDKDIDSEFDLTLHVHKCDCED